MRLLLRVHLVLGLAVSVPLFFWSLSGLVYALPGAVEGGGSYAAIEPARLQVGPAQALRAANLFAGRPLPITALTLAQKDGRLAWEAVGGLGMDSVTIDAGSGTAALTAPPSAATRFFRQAHFLYFSGRAQVPLLLLFAALSCCSVLSGLWLATRRLKSKDSNQ